MGGDSKPVFPLVSIKRLCYLLEIDKDELRTVTFSTEQRYSSFDLWKGARPDGTDKWRHIDNPIEPLRSIQSKIYTRLLKPMAPTMPLYLTGGMPGRSIIDNASPHLGKPVVVGLDIENCFPSVSDMRIFKVWRYSLGCSPMIAGTLTRLTTYQFCLPQGAPTSPMLCNFALAPLAAAINQYATQNGLVFTIYVDDITLSGAPGAARQALQDLIPLVQRFGYKISKEKAVIMDSNEVQKTTGVLVNNRVTTLRRGKLQSIRRDIIRIGSLGAAATTHEINHLWGIINFVKSINPVRGSVLETLAKARIGDTIGTYVPKLKDRTQPCKNVRSKH